MTGIQTVDPKEQQLGPVVWILSKGHRDEGGDIIRVFADKQLARDKFIHEAKGIEQDFGIADICEDEDGAVHLEGGCDWLSLEPHTVTTALELDA